MKNIFHSIGRFWFLILIGVAVVWGLVADSGDSTSSLPPPATATGAAQPNSALPLPANVVSLSNGTVIKKVSLYTQGEGELQIQNGTSDDAVAKLIRNGTSVLTVYIKANSTYTMKNISDGTYWLAFAQGINWDSSSQKFTNDASFSSFDESFDFETSSTQSTTYEVTLNPVEGGTARTSTVNSDQFGAY